MKKTILLVAFAITGISNAQSWNLNGNSGTSGLTDYLGTSDSQDLVLKTNNLERLRIISGGGFKLYTNSVSDDGVDIINQSLNMNEGTDLVWIKSENQQTNDVGLLTLSNSIWQTPVFSARENGKIFMGQNVSNYKLINCSDCNNYRLFVKDGIRTEKVKVEFADVNGWADYVFEKEYKLMSVEDLKKYILQNKHLPEVPTAQEVYKNGIELKEMSALLLKKIEELTLYIIEQDKRINELEIKKQ